MNFNFLEEGKVYKVRYRTWDNSKTVTAKRIWIQLVNRDRHHIQIGGLFVY